MGSDESRKIIPAHPPASKKMYEALAAVLRPRLDEQFHNAQKSPPSPSLDTQPKHPLKAQPTKQDEALTRYAERDRIQEQRKKHEEIRALELANDSLENDNDARKDFAEKIFKLLQVWLASIFIILIFCGLTDSTFTLNVGNLEIRHQGFKLDDKVIIALIGGTTTSVIGIFIVVANYLFPKKK